MYQLSKEEFEKRLKAHKQFWEDAGIEYGYCLCGCGEKTKIAIKTRICCSHILGEPIRFFKRHHNKGKNHPMFGVQRFGTDNPFYGKRHTKKSRQKMHQTHIGLQAGENNPNWKHGKSLEPYSHKFSSVAKSNVRTRDNKTCQWCGRSQVENLKLFNKKLCVHHINYDKENCEDENLISLCCQCHGQTTTRRNEWEQIFKEYNCYL